MNATLAKLFAAALLVLGLVGYLVWQEFDYQTDLLRAQHQQLIQERQGAWAQEDLDRAAAARAAAQARQAQAEADLVTFLGSPLAAATKNPALDIRQMLTQIATAIAPAGTRVAVTVDRFTEFDVALVLPNSPNLSQLATLAKNFLQNASPYVHGLRFISGNELIAELGGADIDSVTDWKTVSPDYLTGMLRGSSAAGPVEGTGAPTDAVAAGTPDEPESLDPDQARQRTAQKNFNDEYRRHVLHLNELLARLSQAIRLDNLPPNGIPARLAWLDQQTPLLDGEEDFLMNQDGALERALTEQGVDPLVVRILIREATARRQPQIPRITPLFDRIYVYQSRIRQFLQAMADHPGDWTAQPEAGKIQFFTAAARDAYETGGAAVEASARDVKAAMQAWSEAAKSP